MNERVLQARVGIMVISAMLLTAILIMLFGKFPTFGERKSMTVDFPTAPGVTEGTPVRKFGKLIGRVSEVEIQEGADKPVHVTLDLDPGARIFDDEVVRIQGNLFGDAVLDIVPGAEKVKDRKEIHHGGTIEKTMVAGDPLEVLTYLDRKSVQGTLDAFEQAASRVALLADNLNKLIGDQDGQEVDKLLDQTRTAMTNFNKTMTSIQQVLGDEQDTERLRSALQGLPDIMEETKQTLKSVHSMATRIDNNMRNLEGITEPLGEAGPELISDLNSAVGRFDEVMEQLALFSTRLNSREGTFGELLNNRQLYDEINSAARNINRVSQQMRPIMSDLRVFSDKIARDPGQLGVRGALQRNAGTKYPNFGYTEPPPADWRTPTPQLPR